MIRIGSRRKGDKGEYVGRPSPLGNPFIIGPDGNRADVIRKYRKWLKANTLSSESPQSQELFRLQQIHDQQNTLTLICWCSPQPCHADVIKEAIENLDAMRDQYVKEHS